MSKNSSFSERLERWSKLNPVAAKQIEELTLKEYFITANEDGKPNLIKKTGDYIDHVHSLENPEKQAQQWFLNLKLENVFVLYVYGIGLGYYYDVIKPWLKENPYRKVVFLEDNLEVIKNFLETERSEEFLYDKQAKLFHFRWDTSYFNFYFITSLFGVSPLKFVASNFYTRTQNDKVSELYTHLAYFHEYRGALSVEYLTLNANGYTSNFYKNLMFLPDAKEASKLKGSFQGIPAIICGAGPSLGKNMHVLKTLSNKALIMAGGTSMNALNGSGFIPHFGVGIDPNPSHYNRLISNLAFDVPFFYRSRMYNEALKTVHADKIYINGAGGYKIPNYFEEKLGLDSHENMAEGHNVINFNIEIAKALGCNPIIIVGVDLAYSNNENYAPGIVPHALQDPKNAFLTKSKHEELLVKNDIYGQPVYTLWKWVNESLWFSQFADRNSDIKILNCTEGGIGFERIPNMSLKDAADKFLIKDFDFASLIHGSLQNASMPKDLKIPKIIDCFESFARSLLVAEKLCFEMSNILKTIHGLEVQKETHEEQSKEFEDKFEQLKKEDCWKYLLDEYQAKYIEIFFPSFQFIDCDEAFCAPTEIVGKRALFDSALYEFVMKVARQNINFIRNVLGRFLEEDKKHFVNMNVLESKLSFDKKRQESLKSDVYSFEDNVLIIKDGELGLNINKKGNFVKYQTFYSNGNVKWEYYLSNGLYAGPSSYFAENGILLARCWYDAGKAQGKAWFYYLTGQLYGLKKYKNNFLEGVEEVYYADGFPRSFISYSQGVLDGQSLLYYSNGTLKRELNFSKGKKDGKETLFSSDGVLLIEAYYKDNRPIDKAKEWYPNGSLHKVITYHENSNEFTVKEWNPDGSEVKHPEMQNLDYIDSVLHQTKTLNDSMKNVYTALVSIAPSVPESKVGETSIEEDLLKLKNSMEEMSVLNNILQKEGGALAGETKEILWKSPEVEQVFAEQINRIGDTLKDFMQNTQTNLTEMIDALEKKHQREEESKSDEK
jgi:antitoxin component YwqK of YwqJK toxin-antitoxin module